VASNKSTFIIHNHRIYFAVVIILAVVFSACSSITRSGENQDPGRAAESQEESGTQLALTETYDHVRNGARLILAYDAQSNSFIGNVENTTDKTLKQVRVEVHLSNGVELGPTTPIDLNPCESIDVTLTATSDGFDGWTAHPEVGEGGGGEHGSSEGEGEHGGEGGSEHNEGGSG
jgi:hypothetical protein